MAENPTREQIEGLREMAANRGCRLVRSRRRKPGGDFGRLGLTDAKSGKQVFGFGKAGLEASPDEIESFLRAGPSSAWKKSLGAAGKAAKDPPSPSKRPAPKAKAEPRPPAKPARATRPAPSRPGRTEAASPKEKSAPAAEPPSLRIRRADSVDGEALAPLLDELGFPSPADAIAERISSLSRSGEPVLVAKLGDEIVGVITWHVTNVLHRPHPVGRITTLVVAASARKKGVGRALVEAAEARLKQRGCGLVEVTSNMKLRAAHAFYRHLGFERTSYRFARPLDR
jgi:ribosomal protein S18 acetylase RimI-like enzyme